MCPPGPRSMSLRVGDELAVDRVADPAFEAAQRFLRLLPGGELALVVVPAGSGVAQLSDRGHVHGVVEPTVPAAVHTRSRLTGAAPRRGRRPVVGGEVVGVDEAGDVTDLTEDDRGDDRSDAAQLRQRRGRGLDRGPDRPVDLERAARRCGPGRRAGPAPGPCGPSRPRRGDAPKPAASSPFPRTSSVSPHQV